MENLIVILAVTGAVLYLIHRGKKAIQPDDTGCDSGDCSACCSRRSGTGEKTCR